MLHRRGILGLVVLGAATLAFGAGARASGGGHGGGSPPPKKPTGPEAPKDATVSKSGEIAYVKLKTMTFTVLQPGAKPGRIALGVDLETKTGQENKVLEVLPRLQNNYVQFFKEDEGRSVVRGKLQLDYIKTNFQRVTDQTIGAGVATVLIREAVKL